VNLVEISLSFKTLARAQFIASLAAGSAWGAGALLGGYGQENALTGIAVACVIFGVSIGVLALFQPNKLRPIATAATLWSAASFVRFFIALLATSLLYYGAQFEVRPLIFSFLLTAIFLLVAETKALAGMFAKSGSQTTN